MRTFIVITLVLLTFLVIGQSIHVFAATIPPYSFGAQETDDDFAIHFNPVAPTGQSVGGGYIHFHPSYAATSPISFTGQNIFAEGEHIGVLTVHRLNRVVNVYEGETMRNMDFGAGRFRFSGINSSNTGLIGVRPDRALLKVDLGTTPQDKAEIDPLYRRSESQTGQ